MDLNNLPPEFYDFMKISGHKDFNATLDKLKQQSIDNQKHKEKIKSIDTLAKNIESMSNHISEHEKNQNLTERKQRFFSWFTFIFSSIVSLGSLVIAIISLIHQC